MPNLKMRNVAVAAVLLALPGCLEDQKQDLARCETNARRIFPGTHRETNVDFKTYLELCMRAAGYEYVPAESDCTLPAGWYTGTTRQTGSLSSSLNAYCYKPMSLLGRLTYPIEMRLERSN